MKSTLKLFFTTVLTGCFVLGVNAIYANDKKSSPFDDEFKYDKFKVCMTDELSQANLTNEEAATSCCNTLYPKMENCVSSVSAPIINGEQPDAKASP